MRRNFKQQQQIQLQHLPPIKKNNNNNNNSEGFTGNRFNRDFLSEDFAKLSKELFRKYLEYPWTLASVICLIEM